jgi:16S rRNA (guanine966-N2)-methyltransferase
MRIISGLYKGRRLKTLDGLSIRPTSDRLRETVFNILAPLIEGARVADLCAGSGAVGIEALSRGADRVFFVEQSPKAAAVIRENLAHCADQADQKNYKLINRPVLTALRYFAAEKLSFDIIYFDPPYDSPLYDQVLLEIAASDILEEDGIVLVEHRRNAPLQPNYDRLRPYREITHGETRLTFYKLEPVIPFSADE